MHNRYSDYDAFARAYSRHWGPKSGRAALAVLHDLLLPRLPAHATVLDLCCGSGHLAHLLTAEGYEVTGLDGSEALLGFARYNAPRAVFILADARSFSLPNCFDAVVCMSDSLNHVLLISELESVFRNVFSALRERGLFLFDLNMEHKYVTSWAGVSAMVDADSVCVIRASYENRIARFDATMFEKDQTWNRSDVALFQTWYAEPDIRAALQRASFRVLATRELPDKVYFLCQNE